MAEASWTKEQMMGTDGGKEPPPKEVTTWGLPGHLTEEEYETFIKFRDEVEKRGGEFKNTVYPFGEVEGEAWTLCRWCRARKFVYDDIIKMVEEATECRSSAVEANFYPVPLDALGCQESHYFAQFPQLYTGYAKNGAPIFISKPGVLNVDAVECLTTLDGIVKFHWYIMIHDFGNLLRKNKEQNPDFKRFECFCILDLDKLTTSQLSSRALAIIKEQSAIDSICFPETMSKMVLLNAPVFFAATWSIIKGWLDPRTAAKIEVFSNRSKGHAKLLELVDADQLPVDYGGKATDTKEILRSNIAGDVTRLHNEILWVRGKGSLVIEVKEGEFLEVSIHTRSTTGAKFSLGDEKDKKKTFVEATVVKHGGSDDTTELPTTVKLGTEKIAGPVKVKVRAESLATRMTSVAYLVIGSIYPTA